MIFFLLLVLFIRSPWGQSIIINKTTEFISEKLDTHFEIGKLYITFGGHISLEDFYLEDTSQDTLIYSKYLEASVPIQPILFGNEVKVDIPKWKGLVLNIERYNTEEGFNFQFIADAFASDEADDSDTTSSNSTQFSVGIVNFEDFKLSFIDDVDNTQAQLSLGLLTLKSKDFDFQAMRFDIEELNLKDTDISFSQNQVKSDSEDEAMSVLPWVSVEEFNLDDISIQYSSPSQSMTSEINQFSFNEFEINFEQKNLFLDELFLVNSEVELRTRTNPEDSESEVDFSWPEWNVDIKTIDVKNQFVFYNQNDKQPHWGQFSTEAMALETLNLKLSNLQIANDEKATFNLEHLTFKSKSGLVMEELSAKLLLNPSEIRLHPFRIQLNSSHLFGDMQVNFKSLGDFFKNPKTSTISVNVNNFDINLEDAFVFAPQFKSDTLIQNLSQHNFYGSLNFDGTLKELDVSSFDVNWGEDTKVSLQGHSSQMESAEGPDFQLKAFKVESTKTDVVNFIPQDQIGLNHPESFVLSGFLNKQGQHYSTKADLDTDFGILKLQADLDFEERIDYEVNVELNSLQLSQFFDNQSFGDLNMSITSKGQGRSFYDLSGKLNSKIDSISIGNYVYDGLKLEGQIENGEGKASFDYADENLQFDFISLFVLDSLSSKVDVVLDLKGIRPQKLGLSRKDFKAKTKAKLHFEGRYDAFNLDAQLSDGVVIYDQTPYDLGEFKFSSTIDSTQTKAHLNSEIFKAQLEANSSFQKITAALQRHYDVYSTNEKPSNYSNSPVKFELELKLNSSSLLKDVFLSGLQRADTLRASVKFDETHNKLESQLTLPYANYKGYKLSGLSAEAFSNGGVAQFNFNIDNGQAGPLDLPSTQISGHFQNDSLGIDVKASTAEKNLIRAEFNLNIDKELKRLNLSPEDLILNGQRWSIAPENEIIFSKDSLRISDFKLKRNEQYLEISDDLEVDSSHLGLVFSNFKLSTFSSYLNPNQSLAEGVLNGRFVVVEPLDFKGLVSNLSIQDLSVNEVALGDLSLSAEANSAASYGIDLNLTGAGIDLAAVGIFEKKKTEDMLDLDINLKHLEMQTLEAFSSEEFSSSEGILTGKFTIDGDLENLNYAGFLAFEEVKFNLNALETRFQLQDERINFAEDKIKFKSFVISDSDGNTITTNGDIELKELNSPQFNLSFDAQNFQILNSEKGDNDLYYGDVIFDATAQLSGDLDLPKLNLELTINEHTDLTYIIPESQASIEEREGIVVFVNKASPDDILSRPDDENYKATVTGIDLSSTIHIEPSAKTKVIFNPKTGDYVSVQGGGDFKFGVSPLGRMDLTGKYEVKSGQVELNLYNFVKREFDIAPSSTVTWTGNPYEANLDLRAIYKIETSASALMASQTAGESPATRNRYKQKLPFLVYLDISEELMSPDLSFQLDMPEDSQGAINGSVYGRIAALNKQEDDLNKQVFSLLVLNRFYPESGSDGSQGGPANLARDNINQAISDQLNNFSNKLTGESGVSLNFDVDSYTDYQSSTTQERTDLDVTAQKKLIDDRLVVEAGSSVNVQGGQRPGESQAVLGNVSVEYRLTEDGRWKLRGFRKSEYENVIDGQVFVSGIALIFTREFNKFKVLWDKAYRKSIMDDLDEKATSEGNIKTDTDE